MSVFEIATVCAAILIGFFLIVLLFVTGIAYILGEIDDIKMTLNAERQKGRRKDEERGRTRNKKTATTDY